MIGRPHTVLAEAFGSRTVKLSLGLVLLTLCLLLLADLSGLRVDGTHARQQAREAVAETLAMRLSLLAGAASPGAVGEAIEVFVAGEPNVLFASLVRADGSRTRFGGGAPESGGERDGRVAQLIVPILDGEQLWGELSVSFRPIDVVREELLYFGFVAAGLLACYLAYLGKLLVQLDPSRAIPERVDSAFNMLVEGVVVLDDKLRVLMANEAAAEIVGRAAEDLVGGRIDDWDWQRDARWQAPWATVLRTGLSITDHPVSLGDEEPTSYTANCSLIRDDAGEPNGVMVTLNDLSVLERKNRELSSTLKKLRRSQESIARKNRELEALASQDPLTGLKNRRAVVEALGRHLHEAAESDRRLACVMLDIDHFKRINDTYGHAAGDEVICAVANVLSEQSRDDDTVGRIGGEEFVVVLPDARIEDAASAAERIRASVERLATDVNVPVDTLSASLGVAVHEPEVTTVEQLLDRADKALYEAKNGGRNRVVTYDPQHEVSGDEPSAEETRAASTREAELARLLETKSRALDDLKTFEPVTGAPRLSVFVERVESAIAEARRNGGSFGVLSVGLHDGERFSAMLGRGGSEKLLQEFARRLREGLRRADLVSDIVGGHSVCHLGTAEFGILLGDVEERTDALTVMTRIRRLFTKPIVIDGTRVHAASVIGAAFYPADGDTAEELISRAARARVEACSRPDRMTLGFVSDSVGPSAREALEMESDLHEAVEKGQLSVQYQPKFDLRTQRVSGMEALVRWQHPERGWISPAEFVPVAERNGLIGDISAFVMRTSLQQLRRWQHEGSGDLRLAMNVSAAQLRDPSLVSDVLEAVESAGVTAEQVEVELTETAVIESPQRARIALGQLRGTGVTVSMDDFGTGYTSLALLADLPLDLVKIDRSFIGAMTDSERGRAIVGSIIGMAHALDLLVVAEGVETNEQLTVLSDLGCDEVQGYLISRPLTDDAMSAFLRQQARDFGARRSA